jgi:hypothetical protein
MKIENARPTALWKMARMKPKMQNLLHFPDPLNPMLEKDSFLTSLT